MLPVRASREEEVVGFLSLEVASRLHDLAGFYRGTWWGQSLGSFLATSKTSGTVTLMTHINMSLWLREGTSTPCFPPTNPAARRLGVRARGGEPVGAALHEPPGRPHQALAPAPAVAVLPLAPARCLHHHVPLLLPGTVPTACSSCVSSFSFLMLLHLLTVPSGRPGIWEEHR